MNAMRRIDLSAALALIVAAMILGMAMFGPLIAPLDPSLTVFAPFSDRGVLGTDFLGRDVLSRLLCGGQDLMVSAITATLVGYAFGATIGLYAGYSNGPPGKLLMRGMDVLLSFPPLLLLLVVATGAGRGQIALTLAIGLIHVPSIARIVRSAVAEHRERAYIEAASLRGERVGYVLYRELLPNIARPLLADAGLRLTWSIMLVASVNFLGLGARPPAANWALMISENRPGMAIQPWGVAAPAILIAALTIAVNIVADWMSGGLGTSQKQVSR